jgi:hypothetical protein
MLVAHNLIVLATYDKGFVLYLFNNNNTCSNWCVNIMHNPIISCLKTLITTESNPPYRLTA